MDSATLNMVEKKYDVMRVRRDFPVLDQLVHGKPLVYLDNAATSQKPQQVLEAIDKFYRVGNANIHRGVHYLSELATEEYEGAREKIRGFMNAASTKEIVFVRGATEGINLVASTFGRTKVSAGDEVLISAMEHHSNIVPWQLLCQEKGAKLTVVPMTDEGEIIPDEYRRLLTERTKLVALTHVSNALGTVNPVRQMIADAHRRSIPVLVDGAQAVPHFRVDVRDLDCDFYALSGHKMFGPTGVGILYGKEAILEELPPYQGGGDMIKSVTFERTIFNDLPYRFEAGTPHIAGAVGLGAAVDYLEQLDWQALSAYEHEVLNYAAEALLEIKGLRIIGTAKEKAGVISFVLEGVHPHDVGTVLDQEGIAVRTGHHCAQPVMQRFSIPATARASFALYNTQEEVDRLVAGVHKVTEIFG